MTQEQLEIVTKVFAIFNPPPKVARRVHRSAVDTQEPYIIIDQAWSVPGPYCLSIGSHESGFVLYDQEGEIIGEPGHFPTIVNEAVKVYAAWRSEAVMDDLATDARVREWDAQNAD